MPAFAVDTFVDDCLTAVRREGRRAPAAVEEVIAAAVSAPAGIADVIGAPADITPFTTWHRSDELTVLHVVWPPGVELLAHDHEMWAAIGLYGGREDNRYFRPDADGALEARGGTTLRSGDTVALGREVVHAVSNPSREWTAAIHVYGGDYFAPERRMWPAPERPPVAFDVGTVISTLEAAAARARS